MFSRFSESFETGVIELRFMIFAKFLDFLFSLGMHHENLVRAPFKSHAYALYSKNLDVKNIHIFLFGFGLFMWPGW